ncbi:eCIS core domain-containing protein [Caballeronia sp. J97]|uniref:eCIS core domain-containing protein n=1 Tax=Caballeronia sp. J97 TaxID=2805429 RepID=UPI002AB1E217|nr:DUF4157 domain-containing protein [Caballeronia sp. J97]
MAGSSPRPVARAPEPDHAVRPARLLRKCACGAPSPGGEMCDECKGKLRAKPAAGPAPVRDAPPSVERALAGGGRPLDAALRQDMERRFGHSFFDVRVHDDAQAQASASDVGARAYTAGRHVVFAAGQYAPRAQEGRRLLAHELAHVVQQRTAAPVVRAKPKKKGGDKPAKPAVPQICGRDSRKVKGNWITKVNIDVGSNTLTIEWDDPSTAPALSKGTHAISPGTGKCCVDCDDEKTSQTDGSLCTPKGSTWKVSDTGCALGGHPSAKNPSYFQRGGIAIHSGNTASPPRSHGCSRTSVQISELIHDNVVIDKTDVAVSGTWSGTQCYMNGKTDTLSNRKDVCDGNTLKKSEPKGKKASLEPQPDEDATPELLADGPGPGNEPASEEPDDEAALAGLETEETDDDRGGESVMQTKLAVGAADDPLEREADRVADRVLASDAASERIAPGQTSAPVVQRDSQPASPNALDKTAQAIVDAARDAKTDVAQRAVDAVWAILRAYYPDEVSKISKVVYDENEIGLATEPVGRGASLTGKITVGRYFVTEIDKFARRVLQVGHELQHVDQERGGMSGDKKKDEREFLAYAWAAMQAPKAGTGRISYVTRRDTIDCALGHYYCLEASDQTKYEDKKKQLLTKRDEVNGKGGNPATDPPTSCKPCSPKKDGRTDKPGKSSAPGAPVKASAQPSTTTVTSAEVNRASARKSPEFSVAAGGEAERSREGTEGKATLSFEASIPLADLMRPGGLHAGSIGGSPLRFFDEFSLEPGVDLASGPQGRLVTPLALEASLKMVSIEWLKDATHDKFTLGLGLEGKASGEYTPQTGEGKVELGGAAGLEAEYKPWEHVFIKVEAKGEGKYSKSGDARFEWNGVSFTAGGKIGFEFGGD